MTTRLLILAAVLAVLVIAATVAIRVRRHPYETFVALTRRALLRAGLTRRSVVVDGRSIVYFAGGSGTRTMVLVHGVNDQAGSWSPVVRHFLGAFRVVALDLPGHGDSEPRDGALPMQLMIDALARVIETESPDAPVELVGNSMGGWVATLYAAEHPTRVAHLVLEDASGMTWDLSHVKAFPQSREESLRLLRMVHGPDAKIPGYLVDAMLKLAPTLPQGRVFAAGVAEWVTDPQLPRLTMPVTLVWGAHDGLLPLAYAEELSRRITGAVLHVVEEAAHVPHRQAPAKFATLVMEAL